MILQGPILAFGGCYSNLQALEALLVQARRLGIPPGNMVNTGDIIAYGADAAATLHLIREAGILSIAGNCEDSLAASSADCGCGFTPGSDCATLATHWYAHAASQMTEADRRYLAVLPQQIDLSLVSSASPRHAGEGRHPRLSAAKIRVLHGNAERINAFIFPSVSNLELERQLTLTGADLIIAGHSGIPFTRRVGAKIWHNPGSIGMPANDGTPRTWFSVIELRGGKIEITPHPLDYDYPAAAAAMRQAALPEGYAAALETGIWPSLDILPAADRYFTGIRLEDQKITEAPPVVELGQLETLWINTGTLCNLACTKCFMESSPTNDSLAYFPLASFRELLAQAPSDLAEIGFTGGEPFMNPDIMPMLEAALAAGKRVLVLTNATRPMQRHANLSRLFASHPGRLAIRVSLDHYLPDRHEALRGKHSFASTMEGLKWLAAAGAKLAVAARTPWGEAEAMMQAGFARLFAAHSLSIDDLILFPEMDFCAPAQPVTAVAVAEAPPVMCQSSRMAVQRKGGSEISFVPCTLLPDRDLSAWDDPVTLDHPHCSRFCVYGGASCAGAPG
jgi:uncharacterized radical SAM superfamily Fe-S cluster-containing enzyme